MRTTEKVEIDLGFCSCGGKPYMLRSAKHKFSIRCDSCRTKTEWLRKSETIIRWFAYLMHDPRVLKRNGTIVLRSTKSRPLIKDD